MNVLQSLISERVAGRYLHVEGYDGRYTNSFYFMFCLRGNERNDLRVSGMIACSKESDFERFAWRYLDVEGYEGRYINFLFLMFSLLGNERM